MILDYIVMGFILGGYLYYVLIVLGNRNKISEESSFNIIKDLIHNYNSINVILNEGIFTIYNIKRRVIKLSNKCYYGNSLSDVGISLMEAGISVIDNNKDREINFFRGFFFNLKWLYVIPLVVIFIISQINTTEDGVILGFLIFISIYFMYMFINIKNRAYNWIVMNIDRIKQINKKDQMKVINFINKMMLCDKFIFWGELVGFLKVVMILLNLKI